MESSTQLEENTRLPVPPSWCRRWMSCHYVSLATYALSALMILQMVLSPCAAAKNVTVECNLYGEDPKCPAHHCCVKKVVILSHPDVVEVGTACEPLRTEGEMCLRDSEGYMCSCLPAMTCDLASPFDTMGYCKPRR